MNDTAGRWLCFRLSDEGAYGSRHGHDQPLHCRNENERRGNGDDDDNEEG